MKRPLVIIKLGGSVITDKSLGKGAYRENVVRRLINEIISAKKKKNFDLILVHGAGSYPHFLTTKYKIGKIFSSKSLEGFSKVKLALSKLNGFIWSECLKAGLNVCTVSATCVVFTKNGEIRSFDTELIEKLLELGVVPILHGDDTLDEVKKIAVLSGDKIMAYLAKKFKASRVIFVSDVDGVFDKNPKVYKDAKLISEINDANFKKIIDSMEVFNKNDASGEMKGKILAIRELLAGRKVEIINGLKANILTNSLSGSGFLGTRINFKQIN